MEFKIVIIVGFCFAFASAQFKTNGTCPNFDECRDPNIEMTEEKIRGIWYLASSIPYFFQLNKKCTYVNITAQPEPNRMHFDKIEYDITTDEKRTTYGVFNITADGILDLTYTNLLLPFHFETLKLTSDYWVLVSCYKCDFFGRPPGIYGYVLTRIAFPECQVETDAIVVLEKCGISRHALINEDQSNCTTCN